MILEDHRTDHKDHGTVEGRLTAIREHGSVQILLRDDALEQTVLCHMPEEMVPDAIAAVRRRVEVTGMIDYEADGTAVSVEVETMEVLPEDDELPTAADVRGILQAAG